MYCNHTTQLIIQIMKSPSSSNQVSDQEQDPRNSLSAQIQQRRQDRELKLALDSIDRRASKKEKQFQESFATNDISPFSHNSFYVRHSKSLTYVALECFHATMFHFIDTVKVRGMARNLTGDVSFYFKNQVQSKPMISGVVSGFMGAAAGSLTFITTFDYLTQYIYQNKKYSDMDFRLKNYLIYLGSDFSASIAKCFLEARKQLIQMQIYEQPLSSIGRAAYLGWFPLMFRDLSFRSIILACYYSTTNVEHQPKLKYTVPQIADIMRQRRAEGHQESFDDISYMFYDYHNYEVKTKLHVRYLYLILANAIATLVTNPIDVCLTKIFTQQEPKYTGFFHCLKTVYKEEGAKKFLSGLHPRFMLNFFNGVMYLYIYDRFVQNVQQIYE